MKTFGLMRRGFALPTLLMVLLTWGVGISASPVGASEESSKETVDADSSNSSGIIATLKDTLTPYGSLRVRVVSTSGASEIQNGSSRIGLRIRREVSPSFAIIGRAEVQVNLVDDPTILTLGDSTGSELVTEENARTFSTRLGWLGFDMGRAGRLTLGKQWSAYYDVAGWTDQYYVFGATSVGVFTGGTDGGAFGTGRAEQALVWRNDFGRWTVGLQFQVKGESSQNAQSIGASLRARVTDWLTLGIAFNAAGLSDVEGVDDVVLFSDDPRSIVVGLQIDKGRLKLAATYADQRQNELGNIGDDLALFDSTGFELYARYGLDDRFGLIGGGNWRDSDDDALNASADIEHYFLGFDWHFHEKSFAYIQGRIAEKRNTDALVAGLRYNF